MQLYHWLYGWPRMTCRSKITLYYGNLAKDFPPLILFALHPRYLNTACLNCIKFTDINSLRCSTAIWRHRSGSTLVQAKACCLLHKATTRNNVDLSPLSFSGIHLWANEMPKQTIIKTSSNISYLFSFKSHRSQWIIPLRQDIQWADWKYNGFVVICFFLEPLLLTFLNLNPSMDK